MSFLNKGRKVQEDSTEEPWRDSSDGKDNGQPVADKIEKAISFFKQKQTGLQNETSQVSLRTGPAETPGGALLTEPAETSERSADKDYGGTFEVPSHQNPEETAAGSPPTGLEEGTDRFLQNTPKEKDKEKPGWVSPAYSQSRRVQLNPKFIAENRCLAYLDNVPEAEAYRILRTQILQRTKGSGGNAIMITSALPGEGKTLTAINLAFTFAREFQHTVLLVDGDLRNQSVHKYLGFDGERGLIDYLADDRPVSELIIWPGVEKMTIISGGRSYDESAEILGSQRMKELISGMKARYPDRYILFDIPPVLTGADALTFAPFVDQVVMVVQAGKTSMNDVEKALQFLPKEKVLGFVLNR